MKEEDVHRQLLQMVAFIKQEAAEKANEIALSAEEEFNILKQQIIETEQRKIRMEYERKEKQLDIQRKTEYSKQLQASRLKILQAQDDLVHDVKRTVQKKVYSLSTNQIPYKQLLKDLILQSLLKLKEPSLILRCRHSDMSMVKSVLQLARDQYAAKTKSHPPDVVIDKKVYLPDMEDMSYDELLNNGHRTCAGGVVLASRDGRIVCDNTLDSRLEVTFQQLLPEIRKRFFANRTVYLKTAVWAEP